MTRQVGYRMAGLFFMLTGVFGRIVEAVPDGREKRWSCSRKSAVPDRQTGDQYCGISSMSVMRVAAILACMRGLGRRKIAWKDLRTFPVICHRNRKGCRG